MNRSWNSRFFLLRGSTLQYYTTPRDPKPREVIDLLHAEVTWLGEVMERPNCIVVEPMAHRTLHISGASLEQSKQWMRWFQEAADPLAYADLQFGPASPISGSPTYGLRNFGASGRSAQPSFMRLPLDFPSHFTEPGHLLEKLVNAGESAKSDPVLSLVDVSDGTRVFVSSAGSSSSRSKGLLLLSLILLLLASLVKVLLVPCATLGLMLLGYHFLFGASKTHREKRGDYAVGVTTVNVSLGGCRNWLLDASRLGTWTPGLVSAFSNTYDDRNDFLHIVTKRGHSVFRRHWWESDDGSVCVVAVKEGGHGYEAWCVKPVKIDFCRVWFISSQSVERVSSALAGLHQIACQYGDHDGINMPRLTAAGENRTWTRHWKGGIVSEGPCVDTSSIRRKLFRSVFLSNSKRLSVKSVFPSSEKGPLQTLPNIFAGLANLDVHSVSDPLRAVTCAMMASLLFSAAALAETAWARYHPKMGDSVLSWIGTDDRAPQVLLEVVEASRPLHSMNAGIRITITGQHWNLKGTIRYSISLETSKVGKGGLVLDLSQSQIELEMANQKPPILLSLPSLVMGVPKDNRVFWTGVLRIAANSSVVLRIDPQGGIAGSILDESGRKQNDLGGHWLENLYVDNECIWVTGRFSTPEISLKRATAGAHETHPSSPKRKPSGIPRMSSADEEALDFIKRLRHDVPELAKHENRASNEYLYRFSKARGFNAEDTRNMISAHLDWVEENKVDDLLKFEFSELPTVKAAFPHGYHGVDKCGRPIYISRLAKTSQDALFRATDWDRFIKFWIQSYEELIWTKIPVCTKNGGKNPTLAGLPPPSTFAPLQTLTILDMKGIGLSQLSTKVREFISVTSKLASDNYPEILGSMYIVNTPAVFPMVWNAVKSMIDPGTRAKTHVLNAKQTREKLLEVVDADQLPCFLGGECKCNHAAVGEDSDYGCLSSDKGPWNPNSKHS